MVKSGKTFIKSVVKQSILKLLNEAKEIHKIDKDLSKRYVKLAWKMVQRYKIKLEPELKMRFCRKCLTIFIQGKTYKVKLDKKNKVRELTCMNCGYTRKMAI